MRKRFQKGPIRKRRVETPVEIPADDARLASQTPPVAKPHRGVSSRVLYRAPIPPAAVCARLRIHRIMIGPVLRHILSGLLLYIGTFAMGWMDDAKSRRSACSHDGRRCLLAGWAGDALGGRSASWAWSQICRTAVGRSTTYAVCHGTCPHGPCNVPDGLSPSK